MKVLTNWRQPIEATKALIKFCEEQDYKTARLDSISACLQALENGDAASAVRHFEAVPLGGMGCFNDWMPTKPSRKNLLKDFDELVRSWSMAMHSLKQIALKNP